MKKYLIGLLLLLSTAMWAEEEFANVFHILPSDFSNLLVYDKELGKDVYKNSRPACVMFHMVGCRPGILLEKVMRERIIPNYPDVDFFILWTNKNKTTEQESKALTRRFEQKDLYPQLWFINGFPNEEVDYFTIYNGYDFHHQEETINIIAMQLNNMLIDMKNVYNFSK